MRIHYNKRAGKITVHYSGKCYLVDHVEIKKPCMVINKPDKKDNPRSWIDVKGKLSVHYGVAVVI